MKDYQTKGCNQYGASMGRSSDLPRDTQGPLTCSKVPLDDGGYDPGGAYWGTPDDLYLIEDSEGRTSYVRACARAVAKNHFPNAEWKIDHHVDLDAMVEGYIAAALFTSSDDDGCPLGDNYIDVEPTVRARMLEDCQVFAGAHLTAIIACINSDPHSIGWAEIGHDFRMTRNGHGCGFWDGDYPEPQASALTEAAEGVGEDYLQAEDCT